jgi:hypothetical protein
VKNLNANREDHVGATAQAMVKIVKNTNVDIMMICLPKDSDSGPKPNGPTMYPTKYMEIGRTSAYEDVIPKCLAMIGMAFEGREEPIVLLITTTIPIRTMPTFLPYENE